MSTMTLFLVVFKTINCLSQFTNKDGLVWSMKLGGCCIKTYSDGVPWRKTLFTSNWHNDQSLDKVGERMRWIVRGLTTKLKVSWKSITTRKMRYNVAFYVSRNVEDDASLKRRLLACHCMF